MQRRRSRSSVGRFWSERRGWGTPTKHADGMDRTSFYKWCQRFQTRGLEGLKDLPPIHKSHSQTTTFGVIERFNGTVLGEFRWVKICECFYDSVEALQEDLDTWLHHYNREGPHLGYHNNGPWDTVQQFVSQ